MTPPGHRRRGGFTLMEVMVVSSMTAGLVVCVLFGTISLQHSDASTEEYAAGQAGVIYAPNHDVDLNMVAAVVAG